METSSEQIYTAVEARLKPTYEGWKHHKAIFKSVRWEEFEAYL